MYVFIVQDDDSKQWGRLDPTMRNVEMLHIIFLDNELEEIHGNKWTTRLYTGMQKKIRRFKTKDGLRRFLTMCDIMK